MTQLSAKTQVPLPPGKRAGTQQTITQLFSVPGHAPMILPAPNFNSNGQTPVKPNNQMKLIPKKRSKHDQWRHQ